MLWRLGEGGLGVSQIFTFKDGAGALDSQKFLKKEQFDLLNEKVAGKLSWALLKIISAHDR